MDHNVATPRAQQALMVLRVGLSCFLFIHGVARALTGGVAGFGEFLDGQGFPGGIAWAWTVTALEVVGTPVLAAGRLVIPLSLYYAFQLVLGVAMVHWTEGWFVVGGGRNGMEYSVLLIVCLLCVALGNWPARGKERVADT